MSIDRTQAGQHLSPVPHAATRHPETIERTFQGVQGSPVTRETSESGRIPARVRARRDSRTSDIDSGLATLASRLSLDTDGHEVPRRGGMARVDVLVVLAKDRDPL